MQCSTNTDTNTVQHKYSAVSIVHNALNVCMYATHIVVCSVTTIVDNVQCAFCIVQCVMEIVYCAVFIGKHGRQHVQHVQRAVHFNALVLHSG